MKDIDITSILATKAPKRPSLNDIIKMEESIRTPNNWAIESIKYDIGLF